MRLSQQFPGIASIMRDGLWQSGVMLYGYALRIGYIYVITTQLGAERYGLFTYGQTYYLLFLPLVIMGLDAILPREIGR